MDFKDILKTVAPGLATALLGPLGGLAVQAIGSALNVPDATQEKIQAAISGASAEDMLKLKQAEQDFQAKMKALDIDLVRIAAGDRDSARKRESETKDWTPKILACVIVTTWGGVQWFLLNHVIADDMRELVMRVLGTLDASLMLVLAYYFGASATPVTTTVQERRR